MEIIIKLEEKGYELTIYRDEDNYTGLNIKQSTAKYAPAIYHAIIIVYVYNVYIMF